MAALACRVYKGGKSDIALVYIDSGGEMATRPAIRATLQGGGLVGCPEVGNLADALYTQ